VTIDSGSRRFGTLTKVPATTAGGWTHEAHDFTPWLADHLDLLGQELGLALQLRSREQAVGRYSLDLLLVDVQERVVIVENQFGQTDHDHLGKLLTYAAGVGAAVVIWIAESFTDEHAAALKWLNETSVDGVAFFGVELELLRIDDSLPAPHFRVVVEPNEWVKRLRPDARAPASWDWDSFASVLGIADQRLGVGQALVTALRGAIDARGLAWQERFNKGYVAFQRRGGYNVVLVDLYWNRAPRLSVKLPAPPDELGLVDPYPELQQSWLPTEGEWGWTVPGLERVPDVSVIVELARTYHPESGPLLLPPS
jgi:hypothetical protein